MRNRAGLVATLTTLLVVAAGCGTETLGPDRGQLAVAAAATADAGSARMEATFAMTSPMFDSTVSMEGVIDIAGEAAHMTMEADFGPQTGLMAAEIIVIDGFQYTRGTLAGQSQPGLDEGMWQRQPMPEPVAGWTDPMSGGDPAGMLDLLTDLGQPVEQVGTEQVRDAGTTHYRVDATMEDLLRLHPANAQEQAQLPPGTDANAVPVVLEVWVDGDDLVRRIRMTMDMTEAAGEMLGDGEMHSVMEMEFYDFGVAVDITAPPEDQVVDYDPAAGPFPAEHPDLDPGFGASDSASESVTMEIPISAEIAHGFPEEFPRHRDSWVMDVEQSGTGGWTMEQYIIVSGQDDVDRVVAEMVDDLGAHGWEILDHSPDRLEIAGHGWRGTVALSTDLDRDQLLVTVTLDPAG